MTATTLNTRPMIFRKGISFGNQENNRKTVNTKGVSSETEKYTPPNNIEQKFGDTFHKEYRPRKNSFVNKTFAQKCKSTFKWIAIATAIGTGIGVLAGNFAGVLTDLFK